MTKDLRLAYSGDIEDWLRIMSNERFRHLPIIDENGKLLNLMSKEILLHLATTNYYWQKII
ncbi:MAG UNVERIFIED_CONTAM: CBS domain-containing protein [Rickettsiaceae bacterium]|jgi:CBS-domain-containing membrane protein